MKTALFFLASLAVSQVFAQSDLTIKPTWTVNCLKHSYPYVNQVFDVQRVSENETTAVWTFTARHGSCDEGGFRNRIIDPMITKKTHFYKSSFLGGSLKKVIQVSEVMNAEDEIQVTLTIDKAGLFAKSNDVKADMIFHPMSIRRFYADRNGGHYYFAPLNFWWNVNAHLDPSAPADKQTSVRVDLK